MVDFDELIDSLFPAVATALAPLASLACVRHVQLLDNFLLLYVQHVVLVGGDNVLIHDLAVVITHQLLLAAVWEFLVQPFLALAAPAVLAQNLLGYLVYARRLCRLLYCVA